MHDTNHAACGCKHHHENTAFKQSAPHTHSAESCTCNHTPSHAHPDNEQQAPPESEESDSTDPAPSACGCKHNHNHNDNCACEHDPVHEDSCGCGHDHSHDDSCGCGHDHAHEDSCGCGHDHAHEDSCGCGHDHAHEDSCGCGHDHSHVPEKNELWAQGACILLAIAFTIIAGRISMPVASFALYLVAYLLVGYKILRTAAHNILRGKIFDENFLMTVATFGAFVIGDYAEAVAVMVFYNIGETLQGMAVAKSRASIANLMDIRPEFARVQQGAALVQVAPEQVRVDDIIVIHPGERIPLDCVVESGSSAVDASALTGESVPLEAVVGKALPSGAVNLNGVLTCRVTSIFAESTVQKILALVSESSGKKAKAEKFITRFSKVYTPCVMAAAAFIAVVPPLFLGWHTFSEWFYRGLIFLVVSCPCALVVSVPVSFLGGIGGAARRGVLVKGGDVIDQLTAPKAVVFDKTGTLTKGAFSVQQAVCAPDVATETLLGVAAVCERSSSHPIAVSVRQYCGALDSGIAVISAEEKAGYGVLATTEDGVYAAGNAKLMQFVGAEIAVQGESESFGTVLHVAKDQTYLGSLYIADEIKDGVPQAIASLKALGVEKCYMLTGDNESIAKRVATAAGLDGYEAGLLPHEKVTAYERLTQNTEGITMYAGDGINDAPLLARADVGIAMGGVGSDAAIEAADLVLMTDDIAQIAGAVRVARHTRTIVKQNIVFALGVKALVLVLATLGYTPMWLAIFADVGVALIAVLNASRSALLKD